MNTQIRCSVLTSAAVAIVVSMSEGWPTAAQSVASSARQWVLYTEGLILPEPVSSGISYRLGQGEVQLVALESERPVFGWRKIPREDRPAGRNVTIHREFEDPNFGDASGTKFVQQREAVALSFKDRGFLMYQSNGSRLGLGWQQKSRYNLVNRTPDIYQWRFANPGDHRDAVDLRTKERMTLFNIVSEQYLVLRERRLAWQRP